MTFIAVSELRKRFPEHKIFLYSPSDIADKSINKDGFTFDFLGWYPMKFSKCQKNPLLRFVCLLKNGKELGEAENVYRNTDFIIDISGYAIGSNWRSKICNDFLDIIEFAKGFDIPVYLMPQSFGPFDFKDEEGLKIDGRIKDLFPYVKTIFAREKECYDLLVDTYGLKNVKLAKDLVLCNKGIDIAKVFDEVPDVIIPDINENSVGLIPNYRNSYIGDHGTVIDLYVKVISKLVDLDKSVYIMTHSNYDTQLCEELKSYFADDERVVLLTKDFSCLEFNELVKKFDYVIASRFHSIVHAYKNGIPCIALGWAAKYRELLSLFGQEKYMFDVRGDVDADSIASAVSEMESSAKRESEKILEILKEVQKENVFDILG